MCIKHIECVKLSKKNGITKNYPIFFSFFYLTDNRKDKFTSFM